MLKSRRSQGFEKAHKAIVNRAGSWVVSYQHATYATIAPLSYIYLSDFHHA